MITSRQNTKIKELVKIIDQTFKDKSIFALEGFTMLEEAVKENANIVEAYVSDEFEEEIKGKYNFRYEVVERNLLKSISKTKTGKDIIFVVKKPEKFDLKELKEDFILALDFVQDPGNMGTIIRSADAFGVRHILTLNNCVNPYNEKVLRATMGSIFRVSIRETSIDDLINLKKYGYNIISTSPVGERIKSFNGKKIVVMGNEGNGVSDDIFNLSDKRVSIPMSGNTESLNVAIATGIVLYIMSEE